MPWPWVGEEVPPDLDWLIKRLQALSPKARDNPGIVADHAFEIRGRWLACRWRDDNKKYKIIEGRAVLVEATHGGTANELERLSQMKGKTARQRGRAWLNTSGAARGLIFRPEPPPIIIGPDGRRWRDDLDVSDLDGIEIPGLHMLTPRNPLPLVKAARTKLETRPAAERKVRRADPPADAFAYAVAAAYRDLTGQRGLYWSDAQSRDSGGLFDLARAIETRFSATGLLSARRLKRAARALA